MGDPVIVTALGNAIPRRGNRFSRALGRFTLTFMGWRFEINFPNTSKFVGVVAPHTSAWDLVIGIMAILALGIKMSWMGKHSLFRWPFGGLLGWLGGIPIDRRFSYGVVENMVERFKNRQELFLAIAPEGTREKVEAWRTGFYYIAHGARVPIVPCYIDYDRKVIGTGPTIDPSGDLAADLQAIQSFYAGITAKNPSQA